MRRMLRQPGTSTTGGDGVTGNLDPFTLGAILGGMFGITTGLLLAWLFRAARRTKA
jgi:hypothetical protein